MKKIKSMLLLFVCTSFLEIYGSQSSRHPLFLSSRQYDFYGYRLSDQKPIIKAIYSKYDEKRWLSPIEVAVAGLQEDAVRYILTKAIITGQHLEMNKAFEIGSKIQLRTMNPKIKERFDDMQFLLSASLVQDVSEPRVPLESIIVSKNRRTLTKNLKK